MEKNNSEPCGSVQIEVIPADFHHRCIGLPKICFTALQSVKQIPIHLTSAPVMLSSLTNPSGVYSPDDYHLAAPLVVIALPSELVTGRGKLFSELPPKLQQTLIDKVQYSSASTIGPVF